MNDQPSTNELVDEISLLDMREDSNSNTEPSVDGMPIDEILAPEEIIDEDMNTNPGGSSDSSSV